MLDSHVNINTIHASIFSENHTWNIGHIGKFAGYYKQHIGLSAWPCDVTQLPYFMNMRKILERSGRKRNAQKNVENISNKSTLLTNALLEKTAAYRSTTIGMHMSTSCLRIAEYIFVTNFSKDISAALLSEYFYKRMYK